MKRWRRDNNRVRTFTATPEDEAPIVVSYCFRSEKVLGLTIDDLDPLIITQKHSRPGDRPSRMIQDASANLKTTFEADFQIRGAGRSRKRLRRYRLRQVSIRQDTKPYLLTFRPPRSFTKSATFVSR